MSPKDTFESIIDIIKLELNYDPWKRFVRTNISEKLMIDFQNDSEVVIPKVVSNFDFKSEYFMNPLIEDKDFEFALSLTNDNYSWEVSFKYNF